MDPFSITVGAIGIADVALSSILRLRDLINGLAEAREVLQDISLDLVGIHRSLQALEALSVPNADISNEAVRDLKKAGLADAVNRCGKACGDFSDSLAKWTRHSSLARLSLRDRLSVGLWNREKIQSLRTQVRSCQGNVQMAVESAQLLIQARSEKSSRAAQEQLPNMFRNLEIRIQSHLDHVKTQTAETNLRLENLREDPSDEEDDDDGLQRQAAIREVQGQLSTLGHDQVLSAVVYSQVHAARTGQKIGDVFVSDDSQARVGMPASVVEKVHNQEIGNVTAQNKSTAQVGIFNDDVRM